MDSLMKLSDSDVEKLIQTMEVDNVPDSVHALCFVKQVQEWRKKDPKINGPIYSPGGDFTDSTFILTFIFERGMFCTYYSSSVAGCIRLRNALLNTNLISKDTYCILTSIPDRVSNIVGLEWRTNVAGPFQHLQQCHDYIISNEDAAALCVPCPEDVYIRDLTEADAELINAMWPHRNDISLNLIRGIISFSTCLGLCSKENGELLSWALKWYYGGIGVVHTQDHAKRKGYAKAVVAALVKRMHNEGWPINLVIIDSNVQSITLFTKLGFQKVSKCQWFYHNVFDQDTKTESP